MTIKNHLYLKGTCLSCSRMKTLAYREKQLDMEGEGKNKFSERFYNKVSEQSGEKVAYNPSRVSEVSINLEEQLLRRTHGYFSSEKASS